MGKDCMDFRWSSQHSNGESARVAAHDQADGAVWVQAYPVKALYSNDGVRDRAVHDEKVAGVRATRGRVRMEQYAVNHLEKARSCDVGGVEIEVARHAPWSFACVECKGRGFEQSHVTGAEPVAFNEVA